MMADNPAPTTDTPRADHGRRRRIKARPTDGFRSKLEQRIATRLDAVDIMWAYEPVTIKYEGRGYTPDFLAFGAFTPRMLIEVKPNIEIAKSELRQDMLVYGSPLWLIADVFVVATDGAWWVRAEGGQWVECSLTNNGLEYLAVEQAP